MTKTFTISLSEQEMQALSGLLDAAQRQLGLQATKPVSHFLDKLEGAVREAQTAPEIIAPARGESPSHTKGHDAHV